MTQTEYASLVITLSALGQHPDLLNQLDQAQLETLVFLLEEARETVEARRLATAGEKR